MAPNASRAVPARTPAPAPASGPADKRPGPGGSPGGQREATWEQFARSVERLAGQLGALAENLPAGEPGDKEAKSLRRSVGRLSEGLGKLKRAPRSGLPG
ncbi:hypothetical protein [Actinacidiphila oryziradicis]|uniref:Uncharacterized protein n=1 Tax=Actinacidiphila oryziradicis TaxID=2571141 RepID=A0A4U0T8W8_9ACTN|nr:hypothetical protein [Actinacidiphila oryziradicis]TKA12005.1 hypothetical protein FCI23_09390 [Actinacidiphila oryziradicis]